ncbi:MAG: hypothetical protein U0637_08825 [Phycisphaerales bacterium]
MRASMLVALVTAASLAPCALCQSTRQAAPPVRIPSGGQPAPQAPRPAPTPAAKPPATPDADAPITFNTDPLTIEAIGLTMLVPEGAEVVADSMAGNTAATFQDKNNDWVIKVQTPRTARKDLTLSKVVDEALEQLLAAHRVLEVDPSKNVAKEQPEAAARVLAREPGAGQTLSITNDGNSLPIERCYVELPPILQKQDSVVRGFTAARIGADQFITFELFTTSTKFERARKIYEMAIGSARFADVSKAKEARAAMVTAGVKFFDGVTRDDIQSIISEQPERWERLYKPSRTGKREDDVEVGYRRVRLSTGREAGASHEGWIVRIDARFLQDKSVVDSQSIFHMAYDRQEENWSVLMTIHGAGGKDAAGKPVAPDKTLSETGARYKDKMQVLVNSAGDAPKTIQPQIMGDGYISRVESFLLPQLLVRKSVPLTYGFYAYQSQAERITMRRDSLERPRADNLPWKLTTRLAEGTPETVSYFTPQGVLTKGDAGNGITSEIIPIKDLYDLWQKKHLPMN